MTPGLRFSSRLSDAGIPHAFTTRVGGVSTGPFASLNFGNPGELESERRDPPENIRANIGRVLLAIGVPTREVVEAHQVHGTGVLEVERRRPAHACDHLTRADAIVTDDASRMLAVRTADCAPILLADARTSAVAAVHAGWRGAVGGVAIAAIRRLCERHAARHLIAAIGPCIGPDHFEVGPEVVDAFARAGLLAAAAPRGSPRGGDRTLLDLKAALAEQMLRQGVEVIEVLPDCTFAMPEAYFSHRRELGLTGRMMSVIGPRM